MASVTFSPIGTQLDNDDIADIQVNEDDRFEIDFTLDTSGLDANLQQLEVQIDQDFAEIDLSVVRTDFDSETFEFTLIDSVENDNFTSGVFQRIGEPGAIPNTINIIVDGEVTALEGINNDGQADLGVTVIKAIDVNGNDVTELFEPANQAIDLQPSSQVQEILGTPESEPIFGTPQNDLIIGGEGNDFIIDSEGDDRSFGEEGNDLFFDDAGDDTIIGGAGNDFVNIDSDSAGNDVIDLGTGNDFAFGGTGADTFVLNLDSGVTGIGDFTPGEDRFALGENLTIDDLHFAQLDNEDLGLFNGSTLISDASTGKLIAIVNLATVEAVSNAEFVNAEDILPTDDSLTTGEENPEPIQAELPEEQSGKIFGTPNPDILVGDGGDNLILAGGDNNFVNAGGGNDRVFGEEKTNIFNGEAGEDLLSGGVSEDALGDFLNGGEGADTLLGNGGNDLLDGNSGNDLLVGGSGIDAINGGQGDDLIFGGAGNDGLFGNEGHDTFVFTPGEGADIVFDFDPEEDALALTTESSYDSLIIEYNSQGNYTNVSDEIGELIVNLLGVEADLLTESNFTTV